MNTRITIAPPLYVEAGGNEACNGSSSALDALMSQSHEGKSRQQAAADLTEGLMQVAISESAEVLAGHIFGAVCLLMEFAGTPGLKNE